MLIWLGQGGRASCSAVPRQAGHYLLARILIPNTLPGQCYTVEARYRNGAYDDRLRDSAVIIQRVYSEPLFGEDAFPCAHGSGCAVSDSDQPAVTEWKPGQTFTDRANGIAITVVEDRGSGFTVTISSP